MHRYIVTELLGPTVKAVEEFSGNPGLLPLQTGRCTTVQYANGLPFRLVYLALSEHGAYWLDLYLGNAAFALPNNNLNSYTIGELYARAARHASG